MPIYALVLTSPPSSPSLSDFAVDRAWSLIPEGQRRSQTWLAPREAWEAQFATNEVAAVGQLRRDVAASLHGITLDVNIVVADPATRRKKLLVADMESTIIEQECLDELAGLVGIGDKIKGITARAMRGEIGFEGALRERVGLLAGVDAGVLDTVYDRVTLMPGATTLVTTMRANGARAALVSGGFTFYTDKIRDRVAFDVAQANTIVVANGKLAGTVADPILGREAKLEALQRLAGEAGIDTAHTMAVGDGANDLAMISQAGLGVAFRAKPIVAAEAAASITHGDLTSLLFLQGYTKAEFVTG
jgi:phosphoserine phosphatase